MTLPKIKTLDQLIHNLNIGGGYDGYLGIMEAIEIPLEDLKQYCIWSNDHYTRNCLYSIPSVEVLLMCWKPGQKTLIHTFDNNQGWIKSIKGGITKTHYYVDEEEKEARKGTSMTIEEGKIAYLTDDMGYHQFMNDSDEDVISLHIHADRIKKWKVFDPEKNEFTQWELGLDSKINYEK